MTPQTDGPAVPEGMVAYGPEHPDYPNAPKDWDEGPYLCRDGKKYHMAGYGWRHGMCCYAETADYDRIAYTPLAVPEAPAPQQAGDGEVLPCDVHLPPATVIKAGCSMSTLRLAMGLEGRPRHFVGHPNASLPAHTATETAGLRAERDALRALLGDYGEKRAPLQGLTGGIPWDMHLRAYDAYAKKWSPQKALIEGGCRGGFGVSELDVFIPGWRDELAHRADAARAIPAALTGKAKA